MEFQLLISLNPSMYLKLLASFSLLNGVKNIEGTSKPFLEVQVTKLKDRIFLACSTNISLVDGTSIWQFFQSWSEIRRGFSFDSISTSISTPPVLDCWFLAILIALFWYLKKNCHYNSLVPVPPLQQRVFHFSREIIIKLKAKAIAETGINRISSPQALAAHLC